MFDLLAANHHGAGWMTTGFAIFLCCLLPFTLVFYIVRFVRDMRRRPMVSGAERTDLSDRLFGWTIAIAIHIGALFLAVHRIAGALGSGV